METLFFTGDFLVHKELKISQNSNYHNSVSFGKKKKEFLLFHLSEHG